MRWRLDRDPHSCTYDQLEEAVSFNLAKITLSPHHTAAWGLLKEDAGLALRFARFTGR